MSSTWVAEFDNEKDYKHFVARFNEIAPNGGNVIVPDLPENPEKVRWRGAWVELKQDVWLYDNEDDEKEPIIKDPAWAVSFDIAIWDNWTKGFIKCLMQEMCYRYSFVEIGCNSVPLVSVEEFLRGKIFHHAKTSMFYIRENIGGSSMYSIEFNKEVEFEQLDEFAEEIDRVEKSFREAAKRFFDGDASDLILSEKGEPQSDFRAEIKRD